MRRLGALDAAFLALEATPSYHMHSMAVMVLDPSTMPGGEPVEVIRDYVAKRIHLVPPMCRRLARSPLSIDTGRWEELPAVDLGHRICCTTLPSGTPADLSAFISMLACQKLDKRHPLWEMHVVKGMEDGLIYVVSKLHHALMDGMAGMEFMASVVSFEPDALPPQGAPSELSPPEPGELAVLAGATWMLRRSLALSRALRTSLISGFKVAERLLNGREANEGLVAPFKAPRTIFDTPITDRREVSAISLPMDGVKTVASAFGVSINDVVLTVVAGALRKFLREWEELPQGQLVAAVPASVRGDRGTEHANLVTLMLTGLATDVEDPACRIAAVHRSAEQAKLLQLAIGPQVFLEWLEVLPPALLSVVTLLYSRLSLSVFHSPLCNVLVSNVPGPPVPIYFAGARIVAVYPLGPIIDGVGLNVTVMSAQGSLDIGLVSCPDRVPRLEDLASAFRFALDELLASCQLTRRGSRPVAPSESVAAP